MKKITTMLALFSLALTTNAQEVKFEVKETYMQESLNAKSPLGEYLQIEHIPTEDKMFLIVTGVHQSSTESSVSVKSEEIYVLSGDKQIENCGEIDLDDNLFEDGAQSIYARKTEQWISLVFMVPREKQIKTMMIGKEKISIGEVARAPKLVAPDFSCEILGKKLVNSVSMKENYDWNDKEGTTYTEKFSTSGGELLRLSLKMIIAEESAFTSSVYFSSKSFHIQLENGIKLNCLGGGSDSDDFNPGYSMSTYSGDLSTEGYIYIPVGKLTIEDLKGAKLKYLENTLVTF